MSSTPPQQWWLSELAQLGYGVGSPVGGRIPGAILFLHYVAVAVALGVCAIPAVLVAQGAPPIALTAMAMPLAFAAIAYYRVHTVKSRPTVTSAGLAFRDGRTVPWESVAAIDVAPWHVSVAWRDRNGASLSRTWSRRRDAFDTRRDHISLRPPL